MIKNLAIALAVCLLLLSASVLPADAEHLYSLTGVVGDANWMPADALRALWRPDLYCAARDGKDWH
jgi:hypothetical protein